MSEHRTIPLPRHELVPPASDAPGPTIDQLVEVQRALREAEEARETLVACPACAACSTCGGIHMVTPEFSGQAFSGFKAAEGFGHEWTPYGEFRGGSGSDMSGRYYVGLDQAMLRSARVRAGHYQVGDRFDLQASGEAGSWTGWIVRVAGYRAPHWSVSAAVVADGAGSPPYPLASIVEPTANTFPIPAAGSGVWKCTTGGTTGATEPVWPGSPVVGVTTVSDGTAVWTYLGSVPEYARIGYVDDPLTHTISQAEKVWKDTPATDASKVSPSTAKRERRYSHSTTAVTANQVLASIPLQDNTANLLEVVVSGFRPGTADLATSKLSGSFARSGVTVNRAGVDGNDTKTYGSLAGSTFDLNINGSNIEVRTTPGTASLVKWGVFAAVNEQSAPFDPADYPATGWWFGYAGPPLPWSGTASVGSSGTRSLTGAIGGFSNSPDLGPELNGHASATYDGTKDAYDGSHDASTFISLSAYRLIALCRPSGLVATSGFAPNDQGIIVCGGSVGLTISTSGVRAYHYDGAYNFADGPSAPIDGDLVVLDVICDGANVTVHINGVAGTPVAAGAVPAFAGQFHVGSNYNGTARFVGDIWEAQTYADDLPEISPEAVYAYFATKYSL